jgi:hypothetical protein
MFAVMFLLDKYIEEYINIKGRERNENILNYYIKSSKQKVSYSAIFLVIPSG